MNNLQRKEVLALLTRYCEIHEHTKFDNFIDNLRTSIEAIDNNIPNLHWEKLAYADGMLTQLMIALLNHSELLTTKLEELTASIEQSKPLVTKLKDLITEITND